MGISRREFLGRVAAIPVAARLLVRAESKPRIAVVGAGAFGGWTALQLRRLGADVTLIDAWGPGNPRSSSGGETRVIRAVYGPDRVYTEMVRRSYELWETLDPALYTETGALWLHRGDDAYVRSSVPVLKDLGFPLDRLELQEATRRWPQIDFNGVRSAWLEKRAGALSARRCCLAVRDAFGTCRIAQATPGPISGERMSSLILGDGTRLEADVFVFACGPWLGRVFPDVVGERIRPTRQEVFYFGIPAGSQRYTPAHLPIWIDFGERIVYGIPDVDGHGFKIADDTRGDPFDPTNGDRTPSAAGLARVRTVLAERFPELAKAPLLRAEVCQYENSPDGHLIVDRHPAAKNVWLLGGGSGHGFKLAPAVGEMTAAAILSDRAIPAQFRLNRETANPSTQFDRKD
jgi:sarcosine oxidase